MKSPNNWIPVTTQLPPNGEVVETKIGSNKSILELRLVGDSWFTVITNTYCYYTPTHWRKKEVKKWIKNNL